jgi:hypothetical protein
MEPEARWLFQQAFLVTDYRHAGIVNRTLKPENTLLHWHAGRSGPRSLSL